MKTPLLRLTYCLPDWYNSPKLLPWGQLVYWSTLLTIMGLMGGVGRAQSLQDEWVAFTGYSQPTESPIGMETPESVIALGGIDPKDSPGETRSESQWLADPEYAALVDLYNSTNGPNWRNNDNWLTGSSPCNWYGVSCTNGRVTQLQLRTNQLSGTIPASLSALTNLQNLYLFNNQLSGPIPSSLSALTQLEILSLYGNFFSSSIPASLSALTNLQYLYLNNNLLSGTIPASLSALANLHLLYLNDNQLSGSIPASLSALTQLQYFSGFNNHLSGSIPASLSALNRLQVLSLYNNQLSGSIPASLSGMTNLQYLSLYNNRLSGSIPASLSALPNLEYLYLYNNQLSGSIPSSLSALTKLQELSLYNNQLSGSIPSSLSALTKLQTLLLRNNQLSGCLPASLLVLCGRNVNLSSNPGLPGGGDFAAFCANRTGQCPLQPDLTLTLYVRPSTISSATALISAVVEVVELNNVASIGPIILKITKDAFLELDFAVNATEIGGKAVTNSSWTFSNADPDYYLLNSAQPVVAGGSQSVGLSGRLRPGATAGGLTLSAVLLGVEGEQKLTNNTDAEKIEYFPY